MQPSISETSIRAKIIGASGSAALRQDVLGSLHRALLLIGNRQGSHVRLGRAQRERRAALWQLDRRVNAVVPAGVSHVFNNASKPVR